MITAPKATNDIFSLGRYIRVYKYALFCVGLQRNLRFSSHSNPEINVQDFILKFFFYTCRFPTYGKRRYLPIFF